MVKFARESNSRSLEVKAMVRPFSNYGFIQEFVGWCPSLHRIMSQVRQHDGKTLVIEKLVTTASNDLREESEDIEKRYKRVESCAHRLSFFSKAFSTEQGLDFVDDDEFIGYAIVKKDDLPQGYNGTRIYESVIRWSRRPNNYIRGARRWRVCVGHRTLHIEGHIYAQQNNLTNVCAHAALRTAAACFHRDGDMTYREMNQVEGVEVDHVKKKVGDGVGLESDEMALILDAAGAGCVVSDYTEYIPGIERPPFQKVVYESVESGFPAIVCFGTKKNDYHAIPLFGHTFNEDTWVPSANFSYFKVGEDTRYIPSESWLSTWIGHDDNVGSNFCVPRDFLYAREECKRKDVASSLCETQDECVAYVMATFPKEVRVRTLKAELIGADILFSLLPVLPHFSEPWDTYLRAYAEGKRLVVRPILLDGPEYVRHLKSLTDWDGNKISRASMDVVSTALMEHLPPGNTMGNIWMVELSVPDLFSANRRKLAEVLIQADVKITQRRGFSSLILVRLPGCFAIPKVKNNRLELRFDPSGTKGHVQLYGCE